MRHFKVRYRKLGGHIHARIFSAADPRGTFAKLGDLTFDEKDWESFQAQVRGWIFVRDDEAPYEQRRDPKCRCAEHAGDASDCPVHSSSSSTP